MEKAKETLIVGLVVMVAVGAVLGAIFLGVSGPYFEAKAFNDCTGGNATYFTAMFTELRVENCNK